MGDLKSDFMAAVRAGGDTRSRAFEFFATQHRARFENGEKGWEFYQELLGVVQEADSGAVKEFQDTFVPLLDQNFMGSKVLGAFSNAVEKRASDDHAAKVRSIEDRLSKGGADGARLFVELARKLYKEKGVEGVMYAIKELYVHLPDEDKGVVLGAALEGVYKNNINIEDE